MADAIAVTGSAVIANAVPPKAGAAWRDGRVWRALLPCALLTVVLGLLSDGAYHDDDLTHFLMARWSRWFPGYLVHVWGRPGLTIPLAAVSWIGTAQTGWHVARLLSALATAASALLAAELAREAGVRRTWPVILLVYSQPLASLLAATTLTENWTALYLVAAVALVHRHRVIAASLIFSVALVTRHEVLILLPLWCGAIWAHHKTTRQAILGLAAAFWAPILHNLVFYLLYEQVPARVFLEATGSTEYLPVGWLAYLPQTLWAIPPALAALAIVGSVEAMRRRAILIAAIPAAFWAAQVGLRALGLFASGGYARFMVAVAPFVAILATLGLERCMTQRRPHGFWWVCLVLWAVGWLAIESEIRAQRLVLPGSTQVGLRVVAPILAALWLAAAAAGDRWCKPIARVAWTAILATLTVQAAAIIRPLRASADARAANGICDWIAGRGLADQPFFATNPWFAFYLGLVENPRARKGPQLLASMPVGTIVVWDSTYGPSDFHRIDGAALYTDRAYEFLRSGPKADMRSAFKVYRKVAPTPETVPTIREFPPDLPSRSRRVTGVYYLRER